MLSLSYLHIQSVSFIFKIYSEFNHFLPPQSKPPPSLACIILSALYLSLPVSLVLVPSNLLLTQEPEGSTENLNQILCSSIAYQGKSQSLHIVNSILHYLQFSILPLIIFLIIHVVPSTMASLAFLTRHTPDQILLSFQISVYLAPSPPSGLYLKVTWSISLNF